MLETDRAYKPNCEQGAFHVGLQLPIGTHTFCLATFSVIR